jgi:hypothetical protein
VPIAASAVTPLTDTVTEPPGTSAPAPSDPPIVTVAVPASIVGESIGPNSGVAFATAMLSTASGAGS